MQLEFEAAPCQRPLLTARHLHLPAGAMDNTAGIDRLASQLGGR